MLRSPALIGATLFALLGGHAQAQYQCQPDTNGLCESAEAIASALLNQHLQPGNKLEEVMPMGSFVTVVSRLPYSETELNRALSLKQLSLTEYQAGIEVEYTAATCANKTMREFVQKGGGSFMSTSTLIVKESLSSKLSNARPTSKHEAS